MRRTTNKGYSSKLNYLGRVKHQCSERCKISLDNNTKDSQSHQYGSWPDVGNNIEYSKQKKVRFADQRISF